MKVKTHVKLAELALNNNISSFPKGFSKFAFDFGLIMIDNSWHVKTHPHYMQKSLEYVIKKIDELLSIKKFNFYYSMQLGIVIHYLCDFCCNAHVSGAVGNISKHVKYERDLQRYLIKNYDILSQHFNETLKNKNSILYSLISIKDSIKNILDNYIKSKASYLLDIKQCVEITFLVCTNIFDFNLSLSKNIEFA